MKLILLAALACACVHDRPIDSVPASNFIVEGQVECFNKTVCLRDASKACRDNGFNSFIVQKERERFVSSLRTIAFELRIKCINSYNVL